MKVATYLFALALPLAAHANPRSRPFSPKFGVPKSSITRDPVLRLRGGDLGPISGKALAKTFGVLAIGDTVGGTVKTVDTWEKFGVEIDPGSKEEHYLGHGIAISASSLAVTSLLALSGRVSVEEAIGYGFLARCAFLTEMLLTGMYKEIGVSTAPHIIIYLILLGTAFGLISGDYDFGAMAKIISIVLAGHGGLLFLNPRMGNDEMEKKMLKIDGGYMFVSTLFSALLAFGMDPVAAMGYTAIFCLPLFLAFLDIMTVDEIFGLSHKTWTFILVAFIGASAYGMLM